MISVFDLFRIGIGPSSSHTVGPMTAARRFAEGLFARGVADRVATVSVELFGSLGATGRGHGTDRALILGLAGERPETVDPERITAFVDAVRGSGRLRLLGRREIAWSDAESLVFLRESLPRHPNAMRFSARAATGEAVLTLVSYSIGGGFVTEESEAGSAQHQAASCGVPFPFHGGSDLLRSCSEHRLRISDLMLANERALRPEPEVRAGLQRLWTVMQECVRRGSETEGPLPGGLGLQRRAGELRRGLLAHPEAALRDPLTAMDWVNLYALAVAEENAAGGRVVTAPTNGAAGIIPAVLHYYARFVPNANDDGIERFLLTAGAIGVLYKENASISGAEVGCQGEVGSACSMAAAGLAEVLGGTPEQIENAAEIAIEHNLGLTCDPIRGLVQVPCIERNAMAAIKAINAARMSLRGKGAHFVPLDRAIRTMRETGADMKDKYKETARGGLALHVVDAAEISVGLPEC